MTTLAYAAAISNGTSNLKVADAPANDPLELEWTAPERGKFDIKVWTTGTGTVEYCMSLTKTDPPADTEIVLNVR